MNGWQVWFGGRKRQVILWTFVVALGGWLFAQRQSTVTPWPPERRQPAVLVSQSTSSPPVAPGSWTQVARATMPAVVNISVTGILPRRGRGPETPSFEPFSGLFFGDPQRPRTDGGMGSGVIVTADGYVITNNHVVAGAEDIRVTLSDRRQFRARLIGTDPKSDVGVLQLTGSGFPLIVLGDSDRVEVAEGVIAIGNPFGLNQTVTQGIVSAIGRANVGIADYEDFIQTDAAINPGNSGGALVNSRGELIGINTAIFTQSGGSTGIGFAVPINMVRQVMDQLVRSGVVTRGYLGITVQEMTPAMARALGLDGPRGILVADVAPESPAAAGGLQRGDIIVAINDKPVEDVGHFRNVVAAAAPASSIRLKVLRNKRETTITVTAAKAPQAAGARAPASAGPGGGLGIDAADPTPELIRRLGLPPGTQGAIVTSVVPGARGAEAGLRPGDLIQEVNGEPVRTVQDFARAVEKAGTRDLLLLVNRGGVPAYLVIERSK